MLESKISREVKQGFRTHSMYEPNSIDCDATEAEMNKFCEDMAALTSHSEPVKVGCMRPYEIDKRELNARRQNDLVIEWE